MNTATVIVDCYLQSKIKSTVHGLHLLLPTIIIIIIYEFHRDASLEQNFRAYYKLM